MPLNGPLCLSSLGIKKDNLVVDYRNCFFLSCQTPQGQFAKCSSKMTIKRQGQLRATPVSKKKSNQFSTPPMAVNKDSLFPSFLSSLLLSFFITVFLSIDISTVPRTTHYLYKDLERRMYGNSRLSATLSIFGLP
jgi:hypothetical protein